MLQPRAAGTGKPEMTPALVQLDRRALPPSTRLRLAAEGLLGRTAHLGIARHTGSCGNKTLSSVMSFPGTS